MSWERQKADSWMQYYVIAQRYYAEHQNLAVTRFFVYDDVWLGNWLIRQRNAFASGKLSEERIEMLNQIGFSWDSCYSRRWEKNYLAAMQFYEANGNLEIPTSNKSLFTWIVDQRSK